MGADHLLGRRRITSGIPPRDTADGCHHCVVGPSHCVSVSGEFRGRVVLNHSVDVNRFRVFLTTCSPIDSNRKGSLPST